jgi:hypothetical protein
MKNYVLGAVALAGAISIIAWSLAYPASGDSKNIRYVLWKHGLCQMDLDRATVAMIGDSRRDRLVFGKTKTELWEKFGYLSTTVEVSLYLNDCYQKSAWSGKDVLFIRKGPWMVVFDGNNAAELVLIKGC